jgi:hypothetical protein
VRRVYAAGSGGMVMEDDPIDTRTPTMWIAIWIATGLFWAWVVGEVVARLVHAAANLTPPF